MRGDGGAAIVSARDLVKIYEMGGGAVRALDGVSFDIFEGEFVSIMGPSGSGKSTLMNLIGALDRPTSGVLEIGGEAVSGMSADRLADLRNRRIGFVFQQFNLLKRASALENVKLPLMYSRNRAQEPQTAAETQLTRVGLGERMDHIPSQLSGGQQQRVAVARALVNNPAILLADEPTGALDTETSNEIMRLFSDLNAEGVTVIIVTHEPEIAEWTDRVIRVRDGKIVEDERKERAAHVVS